MTIDIADRLGLSGLNRCIGGWLHTFSPAISVFRFAPPVAIFSAITESLIFCCWEMCRSTSNALPESIRYLCMSTPCARPTMPRVDTELGAGGWSVSAAGREVGVSRTTGANWPGGYKVYRRGAVVGFVEPLDRLAVNRSAAGNCPWTSRS